MLVYSLVSSYVGSRLPMPPLWNIKWSPYCFPWSQVPVSCLLASVISPSLSLPALILLTIRANKDAFRDKRDRILHLLLIQSSRTPYSNRYRSHCAWQMQAQTSKMPHKVVPDRYISGIYQFTCQQVLLCVNGDSLWYIFIGPG